jgi:hypothetical protein
MFNSAQQKYYDALVNEIRSYHLTNMTHDDHHATFAVGGKVIDAIKKIFANIDLSGMTKEQFLAVVAQAYDTAIAPLFLSMGPMGIFASMAVKTLVMSMAAKFYDNHSKPVPHVV